VLYKSFNVGNDYLIEHNPDSLMDCEFCLFLHKLWPREINFMDYEEKSSSGDEGIYDQFKDVLFNCVIDKHLSTFLKSIGNPLWKKASTPIPLTIDLPEASECAGDRLFKLQGNYFCKLSLTVQGIRRILLDILDLDW
jgi:hypothetical protein